MTLLWLAAAMPSGATAQSAALAPEQSSTVVVTAPRPVKPPPAEAEARLRKIVARQSTAFERVPSYCRSGPISHRELKIMCGRSDIQARDKSLDAALNAFEQHDYPVALQQLEATYSKLGYQDAALMLAHMHRQGLGTPRDAVQGIRWLRAVAEDRFNPFVDTVRFNPDKPEATNARIDAAMALARLYQLGDEVERDLDEAQRWYAKAAEFGYSPAARNLAAAADHPAPPPATAPTAAPGERAPAPASTAPATAIDAADDAADDQVDIADGTLDLALSRLTGNPSDTGALRDVRQAAHVLNLAASPAAASAEPPGEVMFVVHVTSLRAVPWKSYGAMRAAVAAYEKHQALAPDAVFRFAVMPPAGMTLPPNFALRVRSETGQEFPIRLEHGELFTLPPLPELDGKADLVSNFKDGALRIGLLVHSRKIAPDKLRLGDLRLRQAITAAILMFDNPWEYDAQCKRTGRWSRCKRPGTQIWHRPWTGTSGAWIVEGERRTPLQANEDPKNRMYRLPLASAQWGNDAVIEFDYKTPPLRPRKLFEAAIYDGND